MSEIDYSPRERTGLIAFGLIGFFGLNTLFGYAVITRPQAMWDALENPVSLVFIIEAFMLLGLFAYLFGKWGVSCMGWIAFDLLSLLGSMAFAIPVALLWKCKHALPESREHL
jgi:hypothetical protein